jgi:nucleoid-associated protein YgaU
MKHTRVVYLVLVAALLISVGFANAQEMTKDQWQQEITKFTAQRNDLTAKNKALDDQVAAAKAKLAQLTQDGDKSLDDLYTLVGGDRQKAESFRTDIAGLEAKANELMRLSDADLVARAAEVDELDSQVKNLWANKMSLVPEMWDRLTALNNSIKSLKDTLAKQVKVYTVGTWSKDRDCLWNISKKKDIYDNPWMWPKIWQGNRDQIKDPDVIHQGQKLKILNEKELSVDEKGVAKKYYARKAAAAAAAAVTPAPAPAAPAPAK